MKTCSAQATCGVVVGIGDGEGVADGVLDGVALVGPAGGATAADPHALQIATTRKSKVASRLCFTLGITAKLVDSLSSKAR